MFDEKKRLIIEDYNKKPTFASFLPGISGVYGTPIWSFYVNRGQAIASFGAENKDHSIMEFYPAHQSYQLTKTMGFRTFLKVDGVYYEPFRNDDATTTMFVGMNEVEIEETNEELGIKVNVLYYTLPNEKLGGLVRTVTVKNLDGKKKHIEMIDGMPAVLPYGVFLDKVKLEGQTTKAWMQVEDVDKKLPYYRLRFSMLDTTKVSRIEEGNFMLSVDEQGEKLSVIGDPELLFSYDTSFDKPVEFLNSSLSELMERRQICENQLPCGFAVCERELTDEYTVYSLFGQARSKSILEAFAERKPDAGYYRKKYIENNELINELGSMIETKTANPMFDEYCKQDYIDNVLRGGYPVEIADKKVFYVYSRKHGDLERDYNFFSMLPEYFSQGNGNYRDVNQNRRCDNYFSPFVKDYNIKVFYNLLQLDGYNPLVVKQVSYVVKDMAAVLERVASEDREKVEEFLGKEYSPGKLFSFIDIKDIKLLCDVKEFVSFVVANSEEKLNADFGEGYWTDHWTYNLDLVDAYLDVYPEEEKTLLYEDASYTYFESRAVVLPRSKRYFVTEDGVRQYASIDEEVKLGVEHNMARTEYGKGEVYKSNLMTKLMVLSVNKFATLDMYGMGIEMEGGKPGWYDALNGLPGLMGSSMCETYELLRMLKYIRSMTEKYTMDVKVPKELYAFIESVNNALSDYVTENDKLLVWNKVNAAKESYREKTAFGIEGTEATIGASALIEMLDVWISYVEDGIKSACDRTGNIAPAYFSYSMSDYEEKDGNIIPKNLSVVDMPLFLEGPVRYFKLADKTGDNKTMYELIKASDMYDKKLKMYKVNESLKEASFEVGRAKAFVPGWLENESIWLHMEYKYLLELIRGGLYKEFFEDMKNAVVPFLDYEMYGRSPLENSSFLVSSAHSNEKLHGRGFVARLSGSTAEFLSMWELIMFGPKLFDCKDGELYLNIQPAIPAYLIPEDKVVAATLFGRVKVNYSFDAVKDIIPGEYEISSIEIIDEAGNKMDCGNVIKGETAKAVRAGKVKEINVAIK